MMSGVVFTLLVVVIVTVHGIPRKGCICPAVMDPWCGEEGNYYNLCKLICKEDEIKSHTTCEDFEECMKAYPDLPEDEVCAEHGVTFDTIEEMECANMKFVHDGECN
ncbi:uncharacterized protein LOC117321890 isoform X2 [Pecten maximus]|uniref:uncharacterized protein LOC117321890 isoform X2 n=1 Tax=Pecten maximus TaxID=6579 RepID=UPI00145867D1|nr:uncharacterized protein LOC117321890 isoform X2 [Pecten maximus]